MYSTVKKKIYNIIKWLYYSINCESRKLLISKFYRDEYEFFEKIRSHTYSDLAFYEKKLRSLGHQLDKTLVFSTFKEKKTLLERFKLMLEQVKAIPDHDVETVKWCEYVLQEYKNRCEGIPLSNKENKVLNAESNVILRDIIETRRSIRSFRSDTIIKEYLSMILQSGLWAPSGCNRQNIEYLVLEDKNDIYYCQKLAGEGYSFPREAPLNVVVLVDPRAYALPSQRHMAYLEGGAATQNMLLMAHSLGIGSCWLFWAHTGIRQAEFSKKFPLKPWLLPVAMICFGYPDKRPKFVPKRKNLEKCIHWENTANAHRYSL